MQELRRQAYSNCSNGYRHLLFDRCHYPIRQEASSLWSTYLQFQNTRFVLAQAKIDEQATAAFYNENVELYMQGELDVKTAAALKSFSTDMQMKGTEFYCSSLVVMAMS